MVSETKAASDTNLHRHESISSLVPLKFISSINSDRIRKYRSGNKISPNHFIRSINDHEQNNLIQTHFPIARIERDCTMFSQTSSSFQSPTVPKQAGTFLHRLVNKFLSMTNTNRKRGKPRQRNTIFSDENPIFVNITPKKRRGQRLKTITKKTPTNQHCQACRTYRNSLSILPTDSLECPSPSPMMLNTNALPTPTNSFVLLHKSLPKIQFDKLRTLNPSQCQTIASAIQLIFDTLISNYQL